MVSRKKPQLSPHIAQKSDLFDALPDDLVLSILCMLSSAANSPSDVVSVRITYAACKRLNRLAVHPLVLRNAGLKAFDIKAGNWSASAERFLEQCASAGNVEAVYTLGVVRFYCLENRKSGISLMVKAALKAHALATYSMAVILFNSYGDPNYIKNYLRVAAKLCARAASLGHVDALRDLGYRLDRGHGLPRNVLTGRRLLERANALELSAALRRFFTSQEKYPTPWPSPHIFRQILEPKHADHLHHFIVALENWPLTGRSLQLFRRRFGGDLPLQSECGSDVSGPDPHPANRFLVGWFRLRSGSLAPGLRVCSHGWCGRPEIRPNEFYLCGACNEVYYCSRGCQVLDWKTGHHAQCSPAH
ncbi:F-box protein At5g50450-like [Malania oleifera]|uniref:F-box protein At5g50450-like n=1 Tax=Malania oleifera TaxID=397392 RepID=UPI0025AE4587|nr:F-box protein At5g50450-like [Malania oleifera]